VGPAALDPAQWTQFLATLPRLLAVFVWFASACLLVFGLRGYRYYLTAGAALAAGGGGWALAVPMNVNHWYVAIPAALAGLALGVLAFAVVRFFAMSIISACAIAWFVVRALDLPAFAIAFSVGAVAGLGFAYLAPRFSAALLASAAGTMGTLCTLGTLVRLTNSPLAVDAYVKYPLTYTVVGIVMSMTALVAQLARDPVSRGVLTEQGTAL